MIWRALTRFARWFWAYLTGATAYRTPDQKLLARRAFEASLGTIARAVQSMVEAQHVPGENAFLLTGVRAALLRGGKRHMKAARGPRVTEKGAVHKGLDARMVGPTIEGRKAQRPYREAMQAATNLHRDMLRRKVGRAQITKYPNGTVTSDVEWKPGYVTRTDMLAARRQLKHARRGLLFTEGSVVA